MQNVLREMSHATFIAQRTAGDCVARIPMRQALVRAGSERWRSVYHDLDHIIQPG
jgi:hypothetical protein